MKIGRLPFLLLLLFPLFAIGQSGKKLDSLLHLFSVKKDTSRISIALKISKLYSGKNEDSALYFAKTGLNEALAAKLDNKVCDAYLLIGNSFAHQEIKDSAFFYKWKAVELGKKCGYKKAVANGYSDIGLYHQQAGDLDSALKYVLMSVQMKEQLGDENSLAITYTNLALILSSMGNDSSSIGYYHKAELIFLKLRSFRNYTQVLNNIASYYDGIQKYDTAIELYNRAYHIRDSIGDEEGLSQCMLNIGVAYRNKGDLKNSEKYLTDALALKYRIDDRAFIGTCMLDLAFTYRVEGKFTQAKALLQEVDSIILVRPSKELKRDLYLEYSRFYSDQKNFEMALHYNVMYQQMKDSILDDEKARSLAEMQTKYETAKKEKENLNLQAEGKEKELALEKEQNKNLYLYSGIGILVLILLFSVYAYASKRRSGRLLEEKNAQITRQNSTLKELNKKLIDSEEELTELNSQKDKLFSIISHDLSNPVKAISNYNQAVISRKDEMSKEQLSESFDKLNRSLEPLQGFLDNLLHWSALQQRGISVKKQIVNVKAIVGENIDLYNAYCELKKIRINDSVSQGMFETDPDIFRLVIRNILNNAVKFSPEGGTVHINSKNDNRLFSILIRDEGKGISVEKIEQVINGKTIASEKGTSGESGTGLGLNLVREYVTKLEGKLEIRSSAKGTEVEIQLPV
ncbi:MAG TPA: tetratricopeptide repeat protein [Bacteroidia bacterium]|jgi:signal transduction histidine kinase|nr:tetratricopeptide repeat protein [Bacteroidia bacterium]